MASLAILLLLVRFSSAIAVSSNYILRSTEQQVIATVSPAAVADADGQSAQPFLTSPSGSYGAYLRRAVDNSGGLGGDTCYVQIQQPNGGGSMWESDCTPVGGADTCDLAFSPMGLELFAGGHSLWDTGIDADPMMLILDGGGEMRIVSKDGVTVWKASDEPWTGRKCGVALPVSASSPPMDVLPPPSTTSAKLLTPPATTITGPWGWGSDFTFGDQTTPPVDTSPDQLLPPPAADASTDSPPPDLLLPPPPPPPADASIEWPGLPLPPPPVDTYPESPDQPLYSSPPPAPTVFVPQTPIPPVYTPPLATPTGSGETSLGTPPLPEISTPPGSAGDMVFPPPPVGMPHPHGPPHQLPLGASPPVPGALAPSGHHGAGPGLPFGQGQGQGQGVFGQQQQQLLNGAGQPLEDSSGGWSSIEHGRAAVSLVLVGLMALAFVF